ncbi:ribbon-helix-helix domain-containing protein [Sneathiella sp.]|uniref:ribbon-helix-helix domain-containing protein n=1 Tax=Sneathiella sp. TaxID=1964365 RepID=UPI00260D776C|nr:ribbon-helix-helix domain-containing protein [Sneathiella sp.]MDF2365718.1 ribbon-helix-helix domain-containing protein [Sneathiella sp.]
MTQVSQSLINRNISVIDPTSGQPHRTSIRLEEIEWEALRDICARENMSINDFCCRADSDERRQEHSRTSRIRSAILDHYRNQNRNLDS